MQKQKLIIIIDPWKRKLTSKLLFWMAHQSWLFKRIKKFIEQNSNDIHTIVIAAHGDRPADEFVLKIPGNKIETTELQEVLKIVDNYNINQIYFTGSAWDMCVRNRKLGYLNLYNTLKDRDIEFLIKDDCVIYSAKYKAKIFDPKENPDWVPTDQKGIYKYEPK